jgi:hypothetical protein
MIQLNTAISVGDADEYSYSHVKIQKLTFDTLEKRATLKVMAGHILDSEFTPGIIIRGTTQQTVRIEGDDFLALAGAKTTAADVLIYDELSDALYNYLLTEGLYSGTVV